MKKIGILLSAVLLACSINATGVAYAADSEDTLEILTFNCKTKQENIEIYTEEGMEAEVRSKASSLGLTEQEYASGYNPGLPVAPEQSTLSNARAIVGMESQFRVNPTIYPYSAVLLLRTGQDTDGDGDIDVWVKGTGFLEGYDVVVTAAHLIWWPEGDYGWSEDIRMYVNQSGKALGDFHTAYSWSVPSSYISSQTVSSDWCVMVTNEDLGSDNGWFSKALASDLTGTSITVSGYPGETYSKSGYQYSDYGTILKDQNGMITYNADTEGGQSGSPVYDSNYIVWGIHTGEDIAGYNTGVKMSNTLLNYIHTKYLAGLEKWG